MNKSGLHFVCATCGKTLYDIPRDRYAAEYAGQQDCLMCREPVKQPPQDHNDKKPPEKS
ncbi:hypothetical protein D3C71_1081940 [compost metagenome]